MFDHLADWVHASRRQLAFSFPVAVAAGFLAVQYGPPRFLGETLGVINGASGIYLGLAILYLYRSSLQNKKAIRFGHAHSLKLGCLGAVFLLVGVLMTLAVTTRLLWLAFSD